MINFVQDDYHQQLAFAMLLRRGQAMLSCGFVVKPDEYKIEPNLRQPAWVVHKKHQGADQHNYIAISPAFVAVFATTCCPDCAIKEYEGRLAAGNPPLEAVAELTGAQISLLGSVRKSKLSVAEMILKLELGRF